MRIDISVHISDARQWLLGLKSALAVDGHTVRFRIFGEERGRDSATATLKLLELAALGRGKGHWARGNLDHIVPLARDDNADLVISLSGGADAGPRNARILLDGKEGISGAIPELLARRVPFVEIRLADGGHLASGLPAIESPDIMLQALDGFYTRVITLLRMAVRALESRHVPGMATPETSPNDRNPHRFGFSSLGSRLWRRLMRQHQIDDHWKIGIRPRRNTLPIDGDNLIEEFRWIPDDGQRYYADPILFTHETTDFLFMEEFPLATRRGIIAVAELGPDGMPRATPRPVLESAGHLSYPFLFRHDGEIWMMPENAAENRLPLFRARRFPDDWVHERDLLTGVGVHDATLVNHGGAFWLLANTEEDGGSSWDCLSVFRSTGPLGPFERVGAGPVVVDARYARSAGPVISVDGRLLRPVQSCLGHYGRFIRFLEIDSMTDGVFSQRECGRLLAPLSVRAAGVHTYSTSDTFEAIDAFGI